MDDVSDAVKTSCLGKHQHTRATAEKVARRYPEASIYRCPHCRNWHLGHRKPGKTKPRK